MATCGPMLAAHHSLMVAATHTHIIGEWIRLGVGAPSHAPVPLHFHGHQRRSLKILKSSVNARLWRGVTYFTSAPFP